MAAFDQYGFRFPADLPIGASAGIFNSVTIEKGNDLMSDHTVKSCPDCGQKLRFPENIGGMVMSCPSCGRKFYSDFRLNNPHKNPRNERKTNQRPLKAPSRKKPHKGSLNVVA